MLKEPTLSDTFRNNFTSELQGKTHNFTTELQKAYVYYTLLQQLHRAGRARAKDRVEAYIGPRGHLLEDIVERHVDTLRYEFDALYVGQPHKLCPHAECHRDIVVDGNEKHTSLAVLMSCPSRAWKEPNPYAPAHSAPCGAVVTAGSISPAVVLRTPCVTDDGEKKLCLVAGRMPTGVTP